MPSAPPRACRCGALVPAGKRCPRCTKAAERVRGNAAERGYDADWRRVRAQHLAEHPWCSVAGCGEPAVEVDHVISVRERPELRLDRGNLRSMCKPHHSARTIADQGANRGKGARR
jgi:5-methylcytosine-specific restriction endonuclease McrA